MVSKVLFSRRLQTQTGSALIQALIAVGVVSLLGLGAVQVTSQIRASDQAWGFTPRLNTFANMTLGMVSTPALCGANLSLGGANYVDAVGAQTPIRLSLPLFDDGAGGPLVIPTGAANVNVPELNITVHRVDFIQSRAYNAATDLDSTTGNKTYEGVLQILAYARGNSSVVSRKQVARMSLVVDSANAYVGCQSEKLAADICEEMGGQHHPELTPSCRFPYPDGDCMSMGPGYYIRGINADGTLNCQYQDIKCPANQALVGFVITAGVPVPSCKNLNRGGPPPAAPPAPAPPPPPAPAPPTPPATCTYTAGSRDLGPLEVTMMSGFCPGYYSSGMTYATLPTCDTTTDGREYLRCGTVHFPYTADPSTGVALTDTCACSAPPPPTCTGTWVAAPATGMGPYGVYLPCSNSYMWAAPYGGGGTSNPTGWSGTTPPADGCDEPVENGWGIQMSCLDLNANPSYVDYTCSCP